MTIDDDPLRRDWLFLEAIVGDSGMELWVADDGDPALAPHEPTEGELDDLAAAVGPEQLAAQRAAVDALVRETWQRARGATTVQTTRRAPLPPGMSRVELLAMIEQLQASYPDQFAQHYRNLETMSDETLRALAEDMLALTDDVT